MIPWIMPQVYWRDRGWAVIWTWVLCPAHRVAKCSPDHHVHLENLEAHTSNHYITNWQVIIRSSHLCKFEYFVSSTPSDPQLLHGIWGFTGQKSVFISGLFYTPFTSFYLMSLISIGWDMVENQWLWQKPPVTKMIVTKSNLWRTFQRSKKVVAIPQWRKILWWRTVRIPGLRAPAFHIHLSL
jgi:hypothetical protein